MQSSAHRPTGVSRSRLRYRRPLAVATLRTLLATALVLAALPAAGAPGGPAVGAAEVPEPVTRPVSLPPAVADAPRAAPRFSDPVAGARHADDSRRAAAAGTGLVGRAVSEPLAAGSLAQMLAALAVVLGVLGAAAWLVRRYGRTRFGASATMKLLGVLSIGPRERILLVQVGDQQLLLGVTPGQVRSLQLLPEQVRLDGLDMQTKNPTDASRAGFAQGLAKVMGADRRSA